MSNIRHEVSNIRHEVSNIRHEVSNIRHEVSNTCSDLVRMTLLQKNSKSQYKTFSANIDRRITREKVPADPVARIASGVIGSQSEPFLPVPRQLTWHLTLRSETPRKYFLCERHWHDVPVLVTC